MRLHLDSAVTCSDGAFGDLSDVIIDPGTLQVTHLVVQPPEHHNLARLLPISRARGGDRGNGLMLDCTVAEINELPPIHEADLVRLSERPPRDDNSDVGIEAAAVLPQMESLGAGALGSEPIEVDPFMTVSYDRVPKGTVEIRRHSGVTSADGHHVGHVVAFDLDDAHQIVGLLLERGHLWSKHELEVSSGSIDRIRSDEVVLTLSEDEVER